MSITKKRGGKVEGAHHAKKAQPSARNKKTRGPKSYLEPTKGKVHADVVQGATDMLDEVDDEDGNEGASTLAAGASNFLLNLDERGMSKTKAELEKLRRQELLEQRQEERQNRGKKRKGKGRATDIHLSDDSTDMEGGSIASDSDDLDENEVTGNDDVFSEVSCSPDREVGHLEVLKRRMKRNELEDEKQRADRKRKKLPTRGEAGWSSGEDIDGESEAQSDAGEETVETTSKDEEERRSRAVHEPLPLEIIDMAPSAKRKNPGVKSTIMTGTRFGLQSPYEILSVPKRSQRILLAREQIARLSTDIINDPEVSLGFIKRLSVFAGPSVKSPEDSGRKAKVDDAIRASGILSLCAVFVDVLPGYRIRHLTEAEQKEKVNQELARRREWEQGLVKVYRDYLELCERVTREKTELSKVSLKAMCTLVTKATHFNFRTNLLRSLVSVLSRRSWSELSENANAALIEVLKADRQGEVSLEIVRLLNRMIKEKHFHVHERVLEMLRHLRLRDELRADKRADTTSISRNTDAFDKSLKPKDVRKGKGQHLSKKAVKKMKEVREIEEEMKEAEAEIDLEERERHQSETLKLLFVLYFSILKAPVIAPKLYIAALQGLVLFAHRINIDFFRDLLDVLRQRIQVSLLDGATQDDDNEEEGEEGRTGAGAVEVTGMMTALHCIVTALELLSGQGEALNIDLSDMVRHLFAIMLPLSMHPDIESSEAVATTSSSLLLRAIHLSIVSPPIHTLPAERLAAFVIRMLVCSIHAPPKTALGLLHMVRILISRKEELKGLLDNSDRAKNGHFDPRSDMLDGLRPLQAGYIPWQLHILRRSCHDDVREQCNRIAAM